jgi:hypothetical protein
MIGDSQVANVVKSDSNLSRTLQMVQVMIANPTLAAIIKNNLIDHGVYSNWISDKVSSLKFLFTFLCFLILF